MTAETLEADQIVLTFDAADLARGWLSTSLAASDDEARPALTGVNVEFFDAGVRLVATDSYMLLRSWVPSEGEDTDEPTLDEAPRMTATGMDVYGRGGGLMRHLLKIATAKDAPPLDVKLSVGTDPRADAEPSFDGMERRYLIFDVPNQEILTLPLYEGEWPNWRNLWASFKPETTSEINFVPELIVARLGKLGKLHSESVLRWQFGGSDRVAMIELRPAHPPVMGLAMPVKVNLPTFEPAPPPEDEASIEERFRDAVKDVEE